jgi:hypothetical protein
MTAREALRAFIAALRTAAMAAVTPLLEKNLTKTLMFETPVVFSMSRIIVLAFAAGLLRQLWHAGIAGWPDATLAMATVLALPLLSALERLDPAKAVDLVSLLATRFGVGDPRTLGTVYSPAPNPHAAVEPSKFDDHRND